MERANASSAAPALLLSHEVRGVVDLDMVVSENSGTPKSSILIGFSFINHPFWDTPIFGNTHMFHDFLYVMYDIMVSNDIK